MCFSIEFGNYALCVSVYSLEQMLCMFQHTNWDRCCVCLSAQFWVDAMIVCSNVQFGMVCVRVSAQDSRGMAGEGAKR